MNEQTNQFITERIYALHDSEYRDFTAKLIPNIPKERILGVRIPVLRKLAKQMYSKHPDDSAEFMRALPHRYFDENNMHAFLICQLPTFEETMRHTELFLPHIDNWATCDSFLPGIFDKHPEETFEYILRWLASNRTYTVRYAVGLLLSNFLDEHFSASHLSLVGGIRSEEYYVNMMLAWYFATALAKQPEATLPYIEAKTLPAFVQNKAIQKARESRRISDEMKTRLVNFRK